MDTYEHVGFYGKLEDKKYYGPQRHLKLEAAVIELRDMILNGYDGNKPWVTARLAKMTEDFGLHSALKAEVLPLASSAEDSVRNPIDPTFNKPTTVEVVKTTMASYEGKTSRLGRRFKKVGGNITVNATPTDAS